MAVQRDVQDHFFREAKRLGYVARSAFKLREIQEKKRIIQRGDQVLDLGCAPGAWLQVTCDAIGPRKAGGLVVGVDLKPTPVPSKHTDDRVRTIEADVYELTAERIAETIGVDPSSVDFDVILSDMMASTSGHQPTDHFQSIRLADRALELCDGLLRQDGRFVVKAFEGELYSQFLDSCRERFEKVKGFKPKASRGESREMYVIGEGFTRGR